MNIEDDEGPDPDYGVFGDAGMPKPPIYLPSPEEALRAARWRARREREIEVSRAFNSHMIDLFNSRQK